MNDPWPPRTAFRRPRRATPRTPPQGKEKPDEHKDAQFEPEPDMVDKTDEPSMGVDTSEIRKQIEQKKKKTRKQKQMETKTFRPTVDGELDHLQRRLNQEYIYNTKADPNSVRKMH